MANTTANDIIERAMVKARVISPGESIPGNKADQMLGELNDLLESWAVERVMVIAVVSDSFVLTVNKASYTYGDGGDFDTVRPTVINDDCIIQDGDIFYPCRLKTIGVYRSIPTVLTTKGRPRIFAYVPSYPLMSVYVWPVPSSAYILNMTVFKTVASFATLTAVVDLMPGYRRSVVLNLAVEISPNFGKKVPESLAFLAAQSKQVIKSLNTIQVKPMTTPDLAAMTGNIRRGSILSGPFG